MAVDTSARRSARADSMDLNEFNSKNKATCKDQPKCSINQFLKGLSDKAKGTCAACSFVTCPRDQYRTGSCSGFSNGYECKDQPKCSANQFLKSASEKSKGMCTACTNSTQCPFPDRQQRTAICLAPPLGTTDGYTCDSCKPGFTGSTCEFSRDVACHNHGSPLTTGSCSCDTGFDTGSLCKDCAECVLGAACSKCDLQYL